MAKAKTVVKTSSGRIWSCAAAATGLVGTNERMNWAKVGISPTSSAEAESALFRAAPASASIGKSWSRSGVKKADMIAPLHSTTMNRMTARPASRPERAASADAVIPLISRATTSGTIVILRASSQRPPIGSAIRIARGA